MLFKSHSSEQYAWKNKNTKNEEKHEKLNNNKQINTTKKHNKNKKEKETFSMSSDEHYSINRPITLFLPPPIRRNKNQNEDFKRENGRPVKRILNPPPITTTNNLNKGIALTKQMIPFAEEPPPPPIIASNNLENMRGQVPFIVPNDANNQNDFASKLLGQLFPLNGGGENNNKPISPRMAAAPLAGSPFDLFSNGGGLAAAGQSATPNPLLQMLTQGSTLEQITTLTRNLLQMSNGNKEILSTLMNAITGGGGSQASKLTSSALATASLQKQPQLQNNAISAFLAGNKSLIPSAVIIEDEEVLGNRSNSGRFLEREEIREIASNGTITSFNGFTPEQRKLLAAAVLNGELDPEQAVRLLTSENITTANETISELNRTNIDNSLFDYEEQQHQTFFGTKQKQNQHLINAESKLIEWIQQNRPRHSSENFNEVINKNVTTSSSPLTSPPSHDWNNNFVTSERLPYYGKYCGSFVEQTDSAASHNIAGALWAVDERRLLITKFNFIPLSKSENVTFWAGPSKPTGNAALDLFPSENGFIVEAIPIELNIFNGKIIEIEAKIFSNTLQSETLNKNKNGSEKVSEIKNKNQNSNLLAEREEEEEDEKIIIAANITSNSTKRDRRNLYNEIFDNITEEENDNFTILVSYDAQQDDIEFKENKLEEKIILNNFTSLPVNLEAKNGSFENESFASSFIKNDKFASPNEEKILRNLKSTYYQQTLLLTLPPERLTKLLDWLAVWEHEENKEALAVVLIPKGLQIPSIVQIRAFPSPAIGINGVKMLQSGPIKVLDTKTIEVTEFTFLSDNLPAWFMVGKEIMPNAKGHIVPIFDKTNKSFSCDSLREYHNETVTLRLPDPFDIKDVFWFAIFSIPRNIPLSHIYLPYNDMQLPPDLVNLQTPQCIWRRNIV
uniref:DM13 domain-containing protein n=1 Tax=Meloidogyne enterolobii TaxID=390850 RepID=A0A6V7TJE8_MELEN|nr:unnamed protein product [Meloidogyne enterolobii]